MATRRGFSSPDRGGALGAALLAVVALAGCAPRRAPVRPPDLILVSIDTLRADRLGCYGNPRPVSPEIDRFRAGAALFRTALAQASSTLSSHASMLTSLPPSAHGASFALRRALSSAVPTLAEVLRAAGYRTIAVTASGQLHRSFGLGRGFETYRARSERGRRGVFANRVGTALALLDGGDERPVFLFLHTYEAHHPYAPDPALLAALDPDYRGSLGDRIGVSLLKQVNRGELLLDAADRQRIVRAYEAEIRSVDAGFRALLEGLAARPRHRDAVVVLTSDHGEEFGEHGRVGWHSHTLYDELLRVPLILRLPGGEGGGREVTTPVRLIDLAPTLLDLAGVAAPPSFRGRSLLPFLRGRAPRELPAVASLDAAAGASNALRWEGWKLYDGRLFDLGADAGEQIDRAAAEPERRRELARLLERALAGPAPAGAAPARLDAAAERELRALGYL